MSMKLERNRLQLKKLLYSIKYIVIIYNINLTDILFQTKFIYHLN